MRKPSLIKTIEEEGITIVRTEDGWLAGWISRHQDYVHERNGLVDISLDRFGAGTTIAEAVANAFADRAKPRGPIFKDAI